MGLRSISLHLPLVTGIRSFSSQSDPELRWLLALHHHLLVLLGQHIGHFLGHHPLITAAALDTERHRLK